MSAYALAIASVLLSLERIAYVAVWRRPDAFRRWCNRPLIAAVGEPVDVLFHLFVIFKVLQLAVFAAWCGIHGGGVLWPPPGPAWAIAAGAGLAAAGQFLNASVFYRLGMAGVFYGNRLGRDVAWCEAFPFTWVAHPQYAGAVISIWGFFLAARFPAPDWYALPTLETAYYMLGASFER